MLDEALLNFMVKDCQPLSIVESEGFRELIQALQPSCFANQKDHQTNGGQKVRGGTGTSEKGSTASCGSCCHRAGVSLGLCAPSCHISTPPRLPTSTQSGTTSSSPSPYWFVYSPLEPWVLPRNPS
ncbi:uncharacterized protein KZ484_026796 isoform 2-T2 [Pholidichthys leucotaenia]